MLDFVQRFKARIVVAPSFQITVGPVTFTVPRISEQEKDNIRAEAREALRKEGIGPDEMTSQALTVAFCSRLPYTLARYVTAWSFADGVEAPTFNKQNVAALVAEMSIDERVKFSLDFLNAEAEDEKKILGSATPNTGTGSGQP